MSEINIMDIPVNLDLLIKKNKKDNSKNNGMTVNKIFQEKILLKKKQ